MSFAKDGFRHNFVVWYGFLLYLILYWRASWAMSLFWLTSSRLTWSLPRLRKCCCRGSSTPLTARWRSATCASLPNSPLRRQASLWRSFMCVPLVATRRLKRRSLPSIATATSTSTSTMLIRYSLTISSRLPSHGASLPMLSPYCRSSPEKANGWRIIFSVIAVR